MKRKIISALLIILIIISNYNLIFAIDTNQFKPTSSEGYEGFTEVGGGIISVLQYVGIITGVIVLTIIGIKYMMGSVEEKAEYKKTMVPYIVGCILLMSASVFVEVIAKIFVNV